LIQEAASTRSLSPLWSDTSVVVSPIGSSVLAPFLLLLDLYERAFVLPPKERQNQLVADASRIFMKAVTLHG
jgi:hypothetical protein